MMERKKVAAPAVVGVKVTANHESIDVHPNQVREANEYSKRICGLQPFRGDGKAELSRTDKKRYVDALNRNRSEGQARLVNFDGGYGDPT
jgi:hypothetical protein